MNQPKTLLFSLITLFSFLLASCSSIDKLAQSNAEFDDVYYSAGDKSGTSYYASNNTNSYTQNQNQAYSEPNNSSNEPNLEFDNQNANSDYIDQYQESRLYSDNTASSDTYYNPNYQNNNNQWAPSGFNNANMYPYPNGYYNDPYAFNNNSWGAWNNYYSFPNNFRRGGLAWSFGFGNSWGLNRWNNPYNNFYGGGFNRWNNWNSWNRWNNSWCPNTNRVIVVNNNNTGSNSGNDATRISRYYGPRYQNGNREVVSNEARRTRVRNDRTNNNNTGNVGGRSSEPNYADRYNTRTRNSYSNSNNSVNSNSTHSNNSNYIPRTRTRTQTNNTTTSPNRNNTTTSPNRNNTTTSPNRNNNRYSPTRNRTNTSPNRNNNRYSPTRNRSTTSPSRSNINRGSRSSPSRSRSSSGSSKSSSSSSRVRKR